MMDLAIESVLAIRVAIIQRLLDLVYHEVDKYMHGNTTVCKCSKDQEACGAAKYGRLVLALGRSGLWPRQTGKTYRGPIWELMRNLIALEVVPYQDNSADLPRQDHTNCGLLTRRVEGVTWLLSLYFPTPSAVLDCHIRHMKMRNGTAEISDQQIYRCVRCDTSHVLDDVCSPNPRKRPAE